MDALDVYMTTCADRHSTQKPGRCKEVETRSHELRNLWPTWVLTDVLRVRTSKAVNSKYLTLFNWMQIWKCTHMWIYSLYLQVKAIFQIHTWKYQHYILTNLGSTRHHDSQRNNWKILPLIAMSICIYTYILFQIGFSSALDFCLFSDFWKPNPVAQFDGMSCPVDCIQLTGGDLPWLSVKKSGL